MQDVVNVLRASVEIQRIQQLLGSQMIIIEGAAERIAMGEKLAAEIDKAKRRFRGIGYRIDVSVQESEGGKKLSSRFYSFVTEAKQSTRVSIRRQAPPKTPTAPASEIKQPPDSGHERIIDCHVLAENEHSLELSVEVGFARDMTQTAGNGALLRCFEAESSSRLN